MLKSINYFCNGNVGETDVKFKEGQHFAVFSDVHANLPALEAVLSDIDKAGIRDIWCLGDLVDFAPWPNEVITMIRDRNITTIIGNHDKRVALNRPVSLRPWYSTYEQEAHEQAIALSKDTLSKENLEWISSLPRTISIKVGTVRIMMVHASPDSMSEPVHREFPKNKIFEWQTKHEFDILICSHTHCADIREIVRDDGSTVTVANTGSVGRITAGEPHATWLRGCYTNDRLELKTQYVNYDVVSVVQAIKESSVPDFYAEELYINGIDIFPRIIKKSAN